MGTLWFLPVCHFSKCKQIHVWLPKKDQDSNTDCKESARVLSSTVSTLRLYGGGVGSCMCARFGLLGDLSWMKLKLNEAF